MASPSVWLLVVRNLGFEHPCKKLLLRWNVSRHYGMRTIFPMIKVIDDVEKYAKPSYWILNYSNPASIVSEAAASCVPMPALCYNGSTEPYGKRGAAAAGILEVQS